MFERDRGVCALCGADSDLAERIDYRLKRRRPDDPWEAQSPGSALLREAWGITPWATHWWEADHVVPVSEGGLGCGLDGYRTLCRSCHHRETGLLRRRLNAAKRGRP